MWYAGVVGPVARESPDERDNVSNFKASDLVRKVADEGEPQHHLVVGVVVSEGDVAQILKGMEDELTSSVLGGADAVLVAGVRGPKEFVLR